MMTRLLCLALSLLSGCGALPPINSKVSDCDTHPSGWCQHYVHCLNGELATSCENGIPQKPMSWDQENLKAHDAGCPTAIYDAPGGNLRLCPVLP